MSTPLPAGTKLGRYLIRSLIGAGGMGEVYLADDTLLRRPTAIKLLIGDFSQKEERLHRFEREAYAASSLNHPNIVTIYEIGSDDGHHFIATEFVDGESLRDHARLTRMDVREIIEIAVQVASALTAAHEAGIIHRDVKPENIMLRRDGYVKILDFGLAKLTEEGWTFNSDTEAATQLMIKTEPGRVMGTIDYMSPEQARGREVDPRSDIFSLGIVLYELVAGVKPFSGETKSDVLAAVLTAEAVPLSQRSPSVPAEFNRIITKCLRKNRDERYQTAKELLVDLKSLRQELEFAAKLGLTVSTAGVEPSTLSVSRAQVTLPDPSHPTTISELFIKEVKTHPRRSFLFFAVIGFIIVAGSFGLYKLIMLASRTESFQNMRLAKVTSTGDISSLAVAVSPDGKYVVYATSEAGEESLWVRQVVTSSTVQIVQPAEVQFTGLTFSPDGSYIYYTVEERKQSGLFKVPVLGGPPRKLIDDAGGPVTFSPDGSRLAFRRKTSGQQLLIANADGSSVQVVATRPDQELWLSPAWSPDKQVIVAGVLSLSDNKARLVKVSVADGKEQSLATEPWLNITSLAWLSDGTGLVLTGRDLETKLTQLWLVEYPDGKRTRISNDLSSYFGVSLTADSKTLVSIQGARVTNLWVAPGGDANLAKKITFETGKDEGLSGLDYTPDGKLVYTTRSTGSTDLWIADGDGNNSKQLTNTGKNFYPNVTADGRYIVFISDRSGRNDIWRMDIDGRNPRQLTNTDGVGGRFSLSPTDSSVFYPLLANKISTVWKVSIEGGPSEQVTRVNSSRPLVTEDGQNLICEYGEAGPNSTPRIALISMDGKVSQLYDLPNVLKAGVLQWNHEGRALIYRESRNRVDNLWSQKLDGGAPLQLTDFKTDQIFWFRFNRTGKDLALARGRDGSDVVMFTSFR